MCVRAENKMHSNELQVRVLIIKFRADKLRNTISKDPVDQITTNSLKTTIIYLNKPKEFLLPGHGSSIPVLWNWVNNWVRYHESRRLLNHNSQLDI